MAVGRISDAKSQFFLIKCSWHHTSSRRMFTANSNCSSNNNNDNRESPPVPDPVATLVAARAPYFHSSLDVDVSQSSWTDVYEDVDGNAAGIFGQDWADLPVKHLRVITSKLHVKGTRNLRKPELIGCIVKSYKKRKDQHPPGQVRRDPKTRKQIQCPFRLMNILFSDEFVEDFAELGNVATRIPGNQKRFWQRVASAFVETINVYGTLQFLDDGVMADHSHIDPSRIVPHGMKLGTIWKEIADNYKDSLILFNESEAHDHHFFAFCIDKVETYYLHKYLEIHPNLTGTVEADLPEECDVSFQGDALSTGSCPNKKKRRTSSEMADAVLQNDTDTYNSDFVKKKLVQMKNEKKRQAQEDARRAKEENRLEEEHQQKMQQINFDEWRKTRETIKSLRLELLEDFSLTDEAARSELLEDIGRLVKRKNKLAIELGMD